MKINYKVNGCKDETLDHNERKIIIVVIIDTY